MASVKRDLGVVVHDKVTAERVIQRAKELCGSRGSINTARLYELANILPICFDADPDLGWTSADIDKFEIVHEENGDYVIYPPVPSVISAKEPSKDNVNHPAHYISTTGLETIDVIEAFTADLQGIEAACTANIIKYICRWKRKNGLEDLKKAQWYLNKLIEKESN